MIGKDTIQVWAVGENVRNPWQGKKRDVRLGKITPDGAYSRRGHDGVTDPVGGTDQNLCRFQAEKIDTHIQKDLAFRLESKG
jgi:hypothetical protein